jgi:hypothetical protein
MNYAAYPRPAVEDIARLRRRIAASGLPGKLTDRNLLIGTWNIRAFGRVYEKWDENLEVPNAIYGRWPPLPKSSANWTLSPSRR